MSMRPLLRKRFAVYPGSYSVDAAEAQHKIIMRRAGTLAAVASGALGWGVTMNRTCVLTIAAA